MAVYNRRKDLQSLTGVEVDETGVLGPDEVAANISLIKNKKILIYLFI
jgi:hypothetical protein